MSWLSRRSSVSRGLHRALKNLLIVILLATAAAFLLWSWSNAPDDLLSHLNGQPKQPITKALHEFFPQPH